MKKTLRIVYIIGILIMYTTVLSCSKDNDEELNPMIVGYWQLESRDILNHGEQETISNPVMIIFHFTEEGKYEHYYYDALNDYQLKGFFDYKYSWSFDSTKNRLNLFGNQYYEVLSLVSLKKC